jgi:uncharacterized protein (TIGR02600 family)
MESQSEELMELSRNRGRRGLALVLVLVFLVLITTLVIAFFSSITTEVSASKTYAGGATAKQLADSAVNLVMGSIVMATSERDASGNANAWASQPGMIRTYGTSGFAVSCYKLYSSDNLTLTGSSMPFVPKADIDSQWAAKPALFTDLNAPFVSGSTTHYPIIDGRNLGATTTAPYLGGSPLQAQTYLSASGTAPDVQGFWIVTDPASPSQVGQAPYGNAILLNQGAPAAPNPVPMPVKWIYVLRDGSLIAPDATSANVATFTNISSSKQPSTANPIVGRIAYWTDDESCKVNINTASEAVSGSGSSICWDTPRFYSNYDHDILGRFQPAQNEFQRYPGHPATVCLSAALGKLASLANYPESVYPMTPRTSGSGSLEGTVTASGILPLRTDRLYATSDEFLFQASSSGTARSLNDSTQTALNPETLDRARFFLTASSRAPDVNLFDQPRVCIWPVSSLGTTLPYRSPYDQLIAACGTVNGGAYYFQRSDPNDPNTDLPTNPSTAGLGRNRMLMEYLRNLTGQSIPGFGGSFSLKYSAQDAFGSGTGVSGIERDQILTEIFDYIRSTNTFDQSLATSGTNPVTTYTVPFNTTSGNKEAGVGQVVPIVDGSSGTRGFGRFPTLQQASLIFFPSKDNGASSPVPNQLQAALVLQLAAPSMGYPWSSPWFQIEITGSNGSAIPFTWNDGSTMFTANPLTIGTPYTGSYSSEPDTGGVIGWRRLFYKNSAYLTTGTTGASNAGPGFSTFFPLTTASNATFASEKITAINFHGGTIVVNFFQNTSANTKGTLLQSITLTVPDAPPGGFPLPGLSTTNTPSVPHGPTWSKSWGQRFNVWNTTDVYGTWLGDHDVVRSVLANQGDTRLIAARKTIPGPGGTALFQQHPIWSSTNANMAHALRTSSGVAFYGASYSPSGGGGKLVPLTYPGYSSTPYLGASELNGLNSSPSDCDVSGTSGVFVGGTGKVPGDWDNGISNLRDGPYINKADEGDVADAKAPYPYYYTYAGLVAGQTFFSPNRMMPSAGMFGSLPTGVLENKPWQTLLFRPGPDKHPGLGLYQGSTAYNPPYSTPPDHLLLDLFNMPVVEPYAISEPLSTAGRINMNYQIVPFTYVIRNTGLQAVLKSTQVIAVPDSDAAIYKSSNNGNTAVPLSTHNYRLGLSVPVTLSQFDYRFNTKNDIFRSASEICSIDLVPSDYSGPTAPPLRSGMDAYWAKHQLTGDNSRERPYTNIYPLLTTKSNTFTIHFHVQSLQKAPQSSPNQWQEGRDQVVGEYRGSETVERYVDADDATIPDFADPSHYMQSLDSYPDPGDASGKTTRSAYKFRVLCVNRFSK